MRIIAVITARAVIDRILTHLPGRALPRRWVRRGRAAPRPALPPPTDVDVERVDVKLRSPVLSVTPRPGPLVGAAWRVTWSAPARAVAGAPGSTPAITPRNHG